MDRLEVKFTSDGVDAKSGEFSGYGAVFGNIDSHGDVIVPGAFAKSLGEWRERGRLPSMKLMHGTALTVFTGDDLPIGVWTDMAEDAKGLYVKGRLSGMDTDFGRRVHALMTDRALGGLSIGYKAVRFTRGQGKDEPRRRLEEIRLFEVSVVDEGSNDRALVDDIKAANITTIREFEEFLRDAGGFSHAAAKAIAARGFKAADPRDEDGADAIAALLRRNIETIVPKGN